MRERPLIETLGCREFLDDFFRHTASQFLAVKRHELSLRHSHVLALSCGISSTSCPLFIEPPAVPATAVKVLLICQETCYATAAKRPLDIIRRSLHGRYNRGPERCPFENDCGAAGIEESNR